MIRRAVSAALLLRDAFTGRVLPSAAGVLCTLDGAACPVVRKNDGWLVLTDLAEGEHRLRIRCAGFLEEELALKAAPGEWREDIVALKPGPGYRFPADTAGVSLRVTRKGAPLARGKVWLGMPQRARLKIAQDKGTATGESLRVFCQGSEALLPVPGYYLAADKKGAEKLLLRALEEENATLSAPMTGKHPRGTELIPIQSFQTDEEGRLHALFRSPGTLSLYCDGVWKTEEIRSGEQKLEWDVS